jgi:hypothetical protein
MMSECVMSIYGIARLLQSRDLGPAQILPSIESFGSLVEENCRAMPPIFAALRHDAPSSLRPAIDQLEAATHAIGDEIVRTFEPPGKLGARERLHLERAAVRVGGQLQSACGLLDAVTGAIRPRPALLTLGELLRGRWQARPTFVERRVELNMVAADSHGFEGDPRVMLAFVERAVRVVVEAGETEPFAVMRPGEHGKLVMSVGAVEDIGRSTMERITLDLGPTLEVSDTLFDAIAAVANISTCSRHASLVCIAVAA